MDKYIHILTLNLYCRGLFKSRQAVNITPNTVILLPVPEFVYNYVQKLYEGQYILLAVFQIFLLVVNVK